MNGPKMLEWALLLCASSGPWLWVGAHSGFFLANASGAAVAATDQLAVGALELPALGLQHTQQRLRCETFMRKRPKGRMTNTNLHESCYVAVEFCYVAAVHVLLGDERSMLLDVLQFKEAAVKAVFLLRDLGQLAYEQHAKFKRGVKFHGFIASPCSSYRWPHEWKAAVAVALKRLRECAHRDPFV